MPGDETLQKREQDSESEEDDDDELEQVPHVDVDVTKLNPLSPEVISKQVCVSEVLVYPRDLIALLRCPICRQQSTLVHDILLYPRRTIALIHNLIEHRIGTIGHVAHGKSTVVKAISGVMTVRFKNELVRNITIKLGYANAKVCL